MINITPVSTFTAPVTVVADGDSVNGANSQVTAQALTNRTQELSDRVGTRDAANGFVGLDANKQVAVTSTSGSALTATGNAAGAGVNATGGATAGAGVVATGGATSGDAITAVGGAPNGVAVRATGTGTGNAVEAVAAGNSARAVRGIANGSSGTGVRGESSGTGGSGVVAVASGTTGTALAALASSSSTGLAVVSSGTGLGLTVSGNNTLAPFHMDPTSQPTGPNAVGDMYMATGGVLKVCTVAGSPGTWVSVGTQT